MMDFFRRTFGTAGAIAYLGDTVAHVAVLTGYLATLQDLGRYGLRTDWFFFVLGAYSAMGLVRYATQVRIKRFRSCCFYWLVTLSITVTALLHGFIIVTNDVPHRTLRFFPPWYSWFGLAYCLVFAWYLFRLKLLPEEE